jgi:hypothetical protein
VPLLLQHLESHGGVSPSGSTLRRTLRVMGYRWKRPHYVFARTDPERAGKKAPLLERIRALPKHTVVLLCDESLLWEFPPLRAAWVKNSQEARWRSRATTRGALRGAEPEGCKRLLLTRIRNRAEDFEAFLRHIRAQYRRWDIFLILDQASSHTARKTKALAETLRIAVRLPAHSLSRAESYGAALAAAKGHVSANRVYPHVQEQADASVNHLLSMSSRQVLQTTRYLSANLCLPAKPYGPLAAGHTAPAAGNQVRSSPAIFTSTIDAPTADPYPRLQGSGVGAGALWTCDCL